MAPIARWVAASVTAVCLVAAAAVDDGVAARQRFMGWFTDRGGRANATLAVFDDMGTGVSTAFDVEEGDSVIVVPLTSVVCRDALTGPASVHPHRDLFGSIQADDDLIAAFLLTEAAAGAVRLVRAVACVLACVCVTRVRAS